jgi:hypothetical protein
MKMLRFFILFVAVAAAHAQDCGGVNAGGVCVPPDVAMPGYQQQTPQPPPQKWVDHYGAMATNEPGNVLGVATDMQSESEAKQSAIVDCQAKGGGSSCASLIAYRNGCAVLLVGNKFFNASSAATIEEATQSGMKVCATNGNTNCHVYYSACSLPVRIQ